MDDTHRTVQNFLLSAIQSRLRRGLLPFPENQDDLANKVAEGLFYLSFLPYALSRQDEEPDGSKRHAASPDEMITCVAEEVHTLITDYLNRSGSPLPWTFMNTVNGHLYN